MVYLDNAATTRQFPSVSRIMEETAAAFFANPSSLHSLGFEAEKRLGLARETIAESIGAEPKNIIFTASATEANNAVFASVGISAGGDLRGRNVLVSKIDHPSVLEPAKRLEAMGAELRYIPIAGEASEYDAAAASDLIDEDTALISLTHVNSVTGQIQPIEKIAEAASAKRAAGANRILLHVDAAQSYMKLPLPDLSAAIDCLTASAHKIHGPKGAGFLYAKNPARLRPLLLGGGQENGLRSGTENLPAIAGFAEAVSKTDVSKNLAHVAKLKEELLARCGAARIAQEFGDDVARAKHAPQRGECQGAAAISPYIATLITPFPSEVFVHMAEEKGIYLSAGSACSSKKKGASEAYADLSEDEAALAVRVSFSAENTIADIMTLCEFLRTYEQ
jgi:cysteine desulfurase